MAIKVIVYDDNEALRQSIATLLQEEEDVEFITGFSNAETVENDISQLKPDVILMDIDMPGVDGVTAVERIQKQQPGLPVIMLTVFEDNENIFKAICAGASGYILKRYAAREVVNALHDVLSGGAPMTSSVARKVLQMLPPARHNKEDKTMLTNKESEILHLMVKGFSYKMIAAELKISLDTVRFHIKNIYDKLHVHSSTEAVSKAIRDRLV